MHSKSPFSRGDKGFPSASEDDSGNRGFRDLRKYYVYRYGCPIKDVKTRRTRRRGCRLFYLFFVLFIAVKIDSKLTLHNRGKFYYSTYRVKFKIWRVNF